MTRRRKDEEQPHEQPQPGLLRKVLKLRPETQELLAQVSAYRKEKMIDTIHNLLVEEVQRSAADMKRRIDQLAALSRSSSRSDGDADDE